MFEDSRARGKPTCIPDRDELFVEGMVGRKPKDNPLECRRTAPCSRGICRMKMNPERGPLECEHGKSKEIRIEGRYLVVVIGFSLFLGEARLTSEHENAPRMSAAQ